MGVMIDSIFSRKNKKYCSDNSTRYGLGFWMRVTVGSNSLSCALANDFAV